MVGARQLALDNPGSAHKPMDSADFVTEADLLAACRRQDIRAFEHLYQTHGAQLKSVAYHMVGNRQDAEDAVQETFLKTFRAIGGFHGESSLGTWLCRILINVCYDLGRKRQRETTSSTEDQPTPGSGHVSLRVTLEDALKRINPRHRIVFLLFEVEGLRHSEIASVLEVAEGTSKAWLFEAKKELKRLLTEARR